MSEALHADVLKEAMRVLFSGLEHCRILYRDSLPSGAKMLQKKIFQEEWLSLVLARNGARRDRAE